MVHCPCVRCPSYRYKASDKHMKSFHQHILTFTVANVLDVVDSTMLMSMDRLRLETHLETPFPQNIHLVCIVRYISKIFTFAQMCKIVQYHQQTNCGKVYGEILIL